MKKPNQLSFCAAALIATSGLAFNACANEPGFPTRTVQMVVPATPGTTGDLLMRTLAPKLSERWKVAVVVENKVGAGSAIGNDFVAKANPDGHTLLVVTTAFTALPAVRQNLPYDPLGDFSPMLTIGYTPLVMAVSPALGINSLDKFVDYVKSKDAMSLDYGSPGLGSIHHLSMERFLTKTGLKMTHVPYKGTSGVINDLIANHVDASFIVEQTASAFIDSGKLVPLAMTSTARTDAHPKVPTFIELAYPDFEVQSWVGIAGPKGVPDAVIQKINADITAVMKQPDMLSALQKLGVTPNPGTPQDMAALVKQDINTWAQAAAAAGLEKQ